jgi:hypothetical protein
MDELGGGDTIEGLYWSKCSEEIFNSVFVVVRRQDPTENSSDEWDISSNCTTSWGP